MLDLSSERDELESLGNEKVETLEQQLETLPDELILTETQGDQVAWNTLLTYRNPSTPFLVDVPKPSWHPQRQAAFDPSSDASSRWRCRAIRAGGTVSLLRLTRQCSRSIDLPGFEATTIVSSYTVQPTHLEECLDERLRLELPFLLLPSNATIAAIQTQFSDLNTPQNANRRPSLLAWSPRNNLTASKQQCHWHCQRWHAHALAQPAHAWNVAIALTVLLWGYVFEPHFSLDSIWVGVRRPQHLQLSSPSATTAMPKSAHSLEGATVEDHAAMKKQWQTNLEIDLLKSAWIRKDREQHGAHTAPPLSAAK
ncbi:hypothetical protein PC128_g11128 [Phytophthora cactorum]|nr:hypothetical protein PC128_g11128 [Phytophthora cactorum]KAG4056120.1 hypothetical protein PC123_g8818 [Phytophthora cactorum]